MTFEPLASNARAQDFSPLGKGGEIAEVGRMAAESEVGFGTSGARGLAVKITDRVAYVYAAAFLQHLKSRGELGAAGSPIGSGGDLRASSPRIRAAAVQAVRDFGLLPLDFGEISSPALALYGIRHRIPTITVTGSHIPGDRNGIKFTTAKGEITKEDEAGIKAQRVFVPAGLFDSGGMFTGSHPLPASSSEAVSQYLSRYLQWVKPGALKGIRLGVYEQSAVARDLMVELYRALGAEVVSLGRSKTFVPVDTEAIREEDFKLARGWAAQHHLDCIISADGDSDRPLVSDEKGEWLRGDVLGIITAQYLGVEALAVPVTCNTAVDKCGAFRAVRRTKVGSPYVIAGMEALASEGYKSVAGYEANGGFLLQSPIVMQGKTLDPLPTRDAVLPQLAVLLLCAARSVAVSELVARLPSRFTASDRLEEFPVAESRRIMSRLTEEQAQPGTYFLSLESLYGGISELDQTDGLRFTFSSGRIIHFRPSGNAPEFRCYSEAESPEIAAQTMKSGLALASRWRTGL